MKKTRFVSFSWLILWAVLFSTSALFGVKVELIGEIKIPTEPEPIKKTFSFCVTEDELFIIPDYEAGNIKIYEKMGASLELVNTIGQKGFGEDNLGEPAYCFYDKDEQKFGFIDYGRRKIFLYDRIGRIKFKRSYEAFCLRLGNDIHLIKDKLLISGYREGDDGKPYDLYSINISHGINTFLLRTYQKYGLKPVDENTAILLKKSIGMNGWFDVQGNDVYYLWEGDLRIIKLNIESNEWVAFTPKVECNYVKPKVSMDILDYRLKRDFKAAKQERDKMYLAKGIFTSNKYVIVVYQLPINQTKIDANLWLQFYTLDGGFLSESPLSAKEGAPTSRMWFDKNKEILYSLSSQSDGNGENYFVLTYKIK